MSPLIKSELDLQNVLISAPEVGMDLMFCSWTSSGWKMWYTWSLFNFLYLLCFAPGMIALDKTGHVAAGTSTNGLTHKVPGYVVML